MNFQHIVHTKLQLHPQEDAEPFEAPKSPLQAGSLLLDLLVQVPDSVMP